MILDLSRCHPAEAISRDHFRQIIYFRALADSTYDPRVELRKIVARRWRVYQGREYFFYAFNRLFRWVSRRGLEATEAGLNLLPRTTLLELVRHSLDNAAADPDMGLDLPGVTSETPVGELLEHLRARVDVEASADQTWLRHEALDEHVLYQACRDHDTDDGRTLVALVALLLLLRERFGLPRRHSEYRREQHLLTEGGSLRNGMARFMHLLNQRLLRQVSLAALLQWLIDDFVIVQHERVATAKLPTTRTECVEWGMACASFPRRFRPPSTTAGS